MSKELKLMHCAACDCVFAIPDALHEVLHADENYAFYCPYGHSLHIPAANRSEKSESESKPKPREFASADVIDMEKYRK